MSDRLSTAEVAAAREAMVQAARSEPGPARALQDVMARLTEHVAEQVHVQRAKHRSRGATDDDLMVLWPLEWVQEGDFDQFQPATLYGLPVTLAMVDEPVVVAK